MDGFIGSIYLQYIGASLIWIFKKIQQNSLIRGKYLLMKY